MANKIHVYRHSIEFYLVKVQYYFLQLFKMLNFVMLWDGLESGYFTHNFLYIKA